MSAITEVAEMVIAQWDREHHDQQEEPSTYFTAYLRRVPRYTCNNSKHVLRRIASSAKRRSRRRKDAGRKLPQGPGVHCATVLGLSCRFLNSSSVEVEVRTLLPSIFIIPEECHEVRRSR
jgi:hypothetical protein